MNNMNRRSIIASLGSASLPLISGCTSMRNNQQDTDPGDFPRASFKMDRCSDIEIARRVTYDIESDHRKTERRFAVSVIEDGPITTTAMEEPFPENTSFVYDRTVFELSHIVLDTFDATEFRISLSETDEELDQVIEYRDLQEIDAQKLEKYGWEDGGPFEVESVPIVYRDSRLSDSVLVPNPEYDGISWNGDVAKVVVEKIGERELNKYEYTADKIRESAANYGKSVRQEHEFTLEDLSEKQHQIVAEAIDRDLGYVVKEGSLPSSFKELVQKITDNRGFENGSDTNGSVPKGNEIQISESYIIHYQENMFWTELFVQSKDN